MLEDAQLLRLYAREHSEAAFTELVGRHVNLVYAAALRQLGGAAHRAEDVTQSVFIDLARKASVLSRRDEIVGWLYTSTRYAAAKLKRAESRRQQREQEAYVMDELTADCGEALDWGRLRPVLDEAMHELNETDRTVILLRYFQGRRFADVGRRLELTEDAARMKTERALDRLRTVLTKRRITSSSAALGLLLANQPVVALPSGLVASVTAAALATGGVTLFGTVGAYFPMTKLNLVLVGALVIGGLITAGIEARTYQELRITLPASVADETDRLEQTNRQLRDQLTHAVEANPESAERVSLRARMAELKARPAGIVDAELRAPNNVGRATPAAAAESLVWAINQGDLDLVASFFRFTDDTSENRAAFMAKFSDAVRARYSTPERLYAEAVYGIGFRAPKYNVAGVQIVSAEEQARDPGQATVKSWLRTTSGLELGDSLVYQLTEGQWSRQPVSLLNPALVSKLLERFDPTTGDFVQPTAVRNPSRSP